MSDRDDGWRTILAASSALTTATLPVFLLGALSDAIRAELGLGDAAIGAAVTVMFVAAGLGAAPAGRVSERLGGPTALRIGVVVAGLATAAVGLLAHAWWQLALPLVAVGGAVGLVDTGTARAFTDHVPAGGHGLAFGVKEASVPAASLLAGLALPTVSAALGWRATFASTLVIVAIVLTVLPRGHVRARPRSRRAAAPVRARVASPAVVRFAVGAGLGTGAATAAATFLVPAATAHGWSPAAAGGLLSGASIASIFMRVAMGRRADLVSGVPVGTVAGMLAAGGAGAALLAAGDLTAVTVTGAVLLLGGGWGWTGLAFLTIVRARPDAPAAAAGIVLTGLSVGGATGPLAFGAVAGGWSYGVAWILTATALVLGAAIVLSTRGALRRPKDAARQADLRRSRQEP